MYSWDVTSQRKASKKEKAMVVFAHVKYDRLDAFSYKYGVVQAP